MDQITYPAAQNRVFPSGEAASEVISPLSKGMRRRMRPVATRSHRNGPARLRSDQERHLSRSRRRHRRGCILQRVDQAYGILACLDNQQPQVSNGLTQPDRTPSSRCGPSAGATSAEYQARTP
jgi:hypothetical protein